LAEQASRSIDATRAGFLQAQAKLNEASARKQSVKSNVVRREAELKRIKALFKSASVSQSELFRAESQLVMAQSELAVLEAQVDAAKALVQQHEALIAEAQAGRSAAEAKIAVAEAELRGSQLQLEYANVRAPFSGIITNSNAVQGMLTTPPTGEKTNPLFELVADETVTIAGHIKSTQFDQIKKGMPAHAVINNGQGVTGMVSRISPIVTPSRMVRVEIDIDNREGKLRVGMFAKVSIDVGN